MNPKEVPDMDMKSKMTSFLYTAVSAAAAVLMLWSSSSLITDYAGHLEKIENTQVTGVTL
jgi:hypothetical protein